MGSWRVPFLPVGKTSKIPIQPHKAGAALKNGTHNVAHVGYFFNFLNHPLQCVRMPSICNKNARSSIEIEGRIELAISTLKKQEISSIAEAAQLFNVPYTILYH
uniref:HTH psq-type domain-containing protein n=1 Tax=Coccidioides posadasii RMSCC 3488 TaxID=454284 RepID=A0A0J6FG43_COCPO|nr:hypothetical protein CPAG_05574 [Coccidioides posadasii RMSCC 3488]